MNKMTKFSAAALLALFLSACDKPADKTPAAEPAPAAQPAQEAAPAAQPAPAAPEAPAAQAETAPAAPMVKATAEETADYQAFIKWNDEQAPLQMAAQQKFQQALTQAVQAKDDKKISAAVDEFNKSVQATIDSLSKLDVKSDLVKTIKAQNQDVLKMASDLLVDQANFALKQPTEAQTKAYAEKAEQLQAKMHELQKSGAELAAKFAPPAPEAAPAPAPAPAAK